MKEPLNLTARDLAALRALKKITEGQSAFLNIPDADILVTKGLADIFGKGQFVLTEQGHELLESLAIRPRI